jgi:exopolysaccharide biosynthesis polyprenyl glycosylphosphotransferase
MRMRRAPTNGTLARDGTVLLPWRAPRALVWDHRARAKLVAHAGRAAVVWLSVFVPYTSEKASLTASDLVTVSILSAIWLAALRTAFASARAIGAGVSAAVGSCTGLAAVAGLNAWVPNLELGAPTLLGTAVGVFASAGAWEWFVQQTSVGRRRVLLVGTSELADAVAAEIVRTRAWRFQLVGLVEAGRQPANGAVPRLGEADELAAIVQEHRPDLVVLMDDRTYPVAVDRLLDVAGAGFRVVGLSSFFEHAFGRVPLQQLTPAWFMAILHLHQPVYARWSKRTLDLVLACFGLLLAAPLLAASALLVRRTPGPIIYRQTRVGEGGREFTIYKFRTMVTDAEAAGEPRWASTNDDRATSVGRVLRRTHLDELPQLWNVIRGDMSIVGPRPERREFVNRLEAEVPFWSRRLLVKPGLTGWAQLRRGYTSDCPSAAEKLSYDLWYIRHGRLAVDMALCLQTVCVVLDSLLPRLRSGRRRSASLEWVSPSAPAYVPVASPRDVASLGDEDT